MTRHTWPPEGAAGVSGPDEALWRYVARQSDDDVKRDLELVHEPCGTHICDVEPDDTLAVLAATALDHERECPQGGPR